MISEKLRILMAARESNEGFISECVLGKLGGKNNKQSQCVDGVMRSKSVLAFLLPYSL